MSDLQWYSAKLRFAIVIASKGSDTLCDSVYLFKATDFSGAFERALAIGRKAEKKYKNLNQEEVAWILMEVLSLDIIQSPDLDGAEIYSEPIHLDESKTLPPGTKFSPESSKPTQTI